jgi:hypothetical protein
MPGGELGPIGRSGPALSEVAAEMDVIFERASKGHPIGPLRRPAAVAALRPGREGGAAAMILTAAAAGLIGLGAGAFVIRTPGQPVPTDARVAAQAHSPQDKSRKAAPPITVAEAVPAFVVQPVPTPTASPAQASHRHVGAAAKSRAQFRTRLARLDGARAAEARPPIRMREPTPVAQPASCELDALGDDCRQAVVQADRHLRNVYQSAFRRGVSRDVLEDYRDRWADLRVQQTENPARLIESYGALAYDLGRETASDDDAAPRTKPRSGLRALADLLLPWR